MTRKTTNVKTSNWIQTVAVLALAAGTVLGLAAETTLKVGDPAPKLRTGKWVQGDPVSELRKEKAYLVEFWATWCGPCRTSIPHLNEIHNKYNEKGLVVIGQDCWERDDSLVAPFVKSMGDKMTYRVALDDKAGSEKGKMAESWMMAAGRNGIPSAFLVDTQGLVAWIGHPMQLKETVIEEVLSGKFDLPKAAAAYSQRQKNESQLRTVWAALNRATQQKDWDEATAKLAEAEKLLPEDERDNLELTRFNILLGKKDYSTAYKIASKASQAHKDNAMLQNQLAWQIATDETIAQRDLALAETIATRANEAAKGGDPAIVDTLARVLFMRGKKVEAVALEEKAVKLAEGDMQKQLQQVLDSYKRGELPKPY